MGILARTLTAQKTITCTNKNGQLIVDRKELTQNGQMFAEKKRISITLSSQAEKLI